MPRILTLFLLLACVPCLRPAQAAEPWHSIPQGRWQKLPTPSPSQPGFSVVPTSISSITFTNSLDETAAAANRTLYNGSGVATADVDNDGRPDIFFASLEGRSALYRNLGQWHFEDITAKVGLQLQNLAIRGATFADINGDHRPDLLVTTVGQGVHVFLNALPDGFIDATQLAGTDSPFASVTLTLADIDNNGTLDLYAANNRAEDIRDRGSVDLKMSGGKLVVPPALQDRLLVVNGQIREYGEPDQLYLGDGNGRFSPVSWTNGTFLAESGQPLTDLPRDWGLTAAFRDLNGDGHPDLYVCNDYWTPDRLWLNDGQGHFRAAPLLALRHTSGSSMGVDFADIDRDGHTDFFVVDMLSRHWSWRKRQRPAQAPEPPVLGGLTDRPQTLRNTLFHNRGDGTFAEIAAFAGLTASEWAWQPLFIDVDLDGYEDLLITAGYPHDVQDMDAEAQVQARTSTLKPLSTLRDPAARRQEFTKRLRDNMQIYPPLNTEVIAFRNRGNFRFEEMTSQWGTAQLGIHNGIATADFDGDGDLDFVVNRLRDTPGLYQNLGSRPRIAVRLVGESKNTAGIGAKVELLNGAIPMQSQEVVSGGRYASGSDPQLQFAANASAQSMRLVVHWRSGSQLTVEDVQPNRVYELHERAASTPPAPTSKASPRSPLFTESTPRLNHSHLENDFDDFARQPLLPRRFSTAGPGIAWGDFNRDGNEDLFVSSAANGQPAAFLGDGTGGFTPITNRFQPAITQRDQTAVAILTTGTNTLALTAQSNYEDANSTGDFVSVWSLGDVPSFAPPPGAAVNTSSLSLADIDGDGDLDLFAGTRAAPARFPIPQASRLFRWEQTHWATDTRNSNTVARLGMVNGSIWSDLNADGFPELIATTEWGPIQFLTNSSGTLAKWIPEFRTEDGKSTPSSEWTGLWQGIAAGDFDGDGWMDLAASNWGLNHDPAPDPEHPATLFYNQLGGESPEILESVFDPALRELTPQHGLDVLGRAIPQWIDQFRTHAQFSQATLPQLTKGVSPPWQKVTAAKWEHTVFLNRKTHFIAIPLPAVSQWSPAFGIVAADFDGDGHVDLFLAQNFFGTRPGVTRSDAGRGLLLRGLGNGHFEPMPGTDSGIQIYGEQRGAAAADFNKDGRIDLAVTQNSGPTRLFINRSAKPGIRVQLVGPPGNPNGIGAQMRWITPKQSSPAQEIQGGSGYGSQNSSIVTVSRPPVDARLEVLWPGGKRTTHPLPSTASSVEVRLE